MLDRIGLIQIDSVNVLVRSQELPLLARLGPHPRNLIPDATTAGELFEYWVHEASHVRTEHHPLHRWQMAAPHKWSRYHQLEQRRPGFTEQIYRRVEAEGPLTSGDLGERIGAKGQWWDWDDGKIALEHLFWSGRITATRRASDFARRYDLTERVLPSAVLALPTPSERDARLELLRHAAAHLGIATFEDLTDYHRQRNAPCKPLVDELVHEGTLERVEVDGWDRPAYLHARAARPRSIDASALLSPFDPVVWCRPRTERLHGFRYRIEIYTPAPKRVYGYYVLPFLWGDELVGRIDLKADRGRRVLLAPGVFGEPGVPTGPVAASMAERLVEMAHWLDLDDVEVGDRGDLARPVRAAVARYARGR